MADGHGWLRIVAVGLTAAVVGAVSYFLLRPEDEALPHREAGDLPPTAPRGTRASTLRRRLWEERASPPPSEPAREQRSLEATPEEEPAEAAAQEDGGGCATAALHGGAPEPRHAAESEDEEDEVRAPMAPFLVAGAAQPLHAWSTTLSSSQVALLALLALLTLTLTGVQMALTAFLAAAPPQDADAFALDGLEPTRWGEPILLPQLPPAPPVLGWLGAGFVAAAAASAAFGGAGAIRGGAAMPASAHRAMAQRATPPPTTPTTQLTARQSPPLTVRHVGSRSAVPAEEESPGGSGTQGPSGRRRPAAGGPSTGRRLFE